MLPVLVIGTIEIPMYTLMIAIGYGLGFLVALKRYHIESLRKSDACLSYLFAGIGAFVGGKVFYIVQGIPLFLRLHEEYNMSFWEFFERSGLVYYGSFIGIVLFLMLYAKLYHISIWAVLGTLMPALPLAQAFGRVGCFFAGCCYGMESEFGFMMNASDVAPHDVKLFPIQLVEAAACAVLFVIMMRLGKKPRPRGYMPGLYCLGYGIIRFVDEFFRGDTVRGIYAELSVSQWISIGLIVVGVYLLFFFQKKNMGRNTAGSAV